MELSAFSIEHAAPKPTERDQRNGNVVTECNGLFSAAMCARQPQRCRPMWRRKERCRRKRARKRQQQREESSVPICICEKKRTIRV